MAARSGTNDIEFDRHYESGLCPTVSFPVVIWVVTQRSPEERECFVTTRLQKKKKIGEEGEYKFQSLLIKVPGVVANCLPLLSGLGG